MKTRDCVFQDGSYPCCSTPNPDCELCHKSFKAGMRKVVEWIETNHGHIDYLTKREERVRHYCPNCASEIIGVYPSKWQVQFKEWGIK